MKEGKTTTRWIVPCFYTINDESIKPIKIDLTNYLLQMLKNQVWNRKFEFGLSSGLKKTKSKNIINAKAKIYPRFISGYVDEHRISKLINEECGNFPNHLKINNYKSWSHHLGIIIFEVSYNFSTKNIPSKKDLTEDIIPYFNDDFTSDFHYRLAILKELASFLVAGLHLSFPTQSIMMSKTANPINDGLFQIVSGRSSYATQISSNTFMHEILIETDKLSSNLKVNLDALSTVWHYNLWSLKRYLKAVESDQISMDNLLDLIYSLEGLFDKNTSSEFIKSMCILHMCNNKKEATKMKRLLDTAYVIRNNIAHGGISYNPNDIISLNGIEVTAQKIYWKIKPIVASMILFAISKLMKNTEMKNLRFNYNDFINLTYKVNFPIYQTV